MWRKPRKSVPSLRQGCGFDSICVRCVGRRAARGAAVISSGSTGAGARGWLRSVPCLPALPRAPLGTERAAAPAPALPPATGTGTLPWSEPKEPPGSGQGSGWRGAFLWLCIDKKPLNIQYFSGMRVIGEKAGFLSFPFSTRFWAHSSNCNLAQMCCDSQAIVQYLYGAYTADYLSL